MKKYPNAKFVAGGKPWEVKCDVALPCATQNELDENSAQILINNGVKAVAEGANMPTTLEGTKLFQENGVLFGPAKASNAGGVACSALEMSQNSLRMAWTFEEVDNKLKTIMQNKAASKPANWFLLNPFFCSIPTIFSILLNKYFFPAAPNANA